MRHHHGINNVMREKLAPVASKVREIRANVRVVSQISIRLHPVPGRDRFEMTIDSVLRWMNQRAGRGLPHQAWKRKSFEMAEIGSQRVSAISLDDAGYWAGRVDDADKTVPLRTWITEIGVGREENGSVLFGARLICSTRGDDVGFERTVPGFVREILAAGLCSLDNLEITKTPRFISTAGDVAALANHLKNPNRISDAIVLSLPEGSEDPEQTAANARNIQSRLLGVSHVFIIGSQASFMLSDTFGRDLSVYRQGVRTYTPASDFATTSYAQHPLALQQKIANWGEFGPAAFEKWLIDGTMVRTTRSGDRASTEDRLPSFDTVRRIWADQQRAQARNNESSDTVLATLYQQENEQLRRELQEQKDLYDSLLAAADQERANAIERATEYEQLALNRAARIHALEKSVKRDQSVADGKSETPIPGTFDGFEEWCKTHLSGTVELTNRAFQGIRKCDFHDPSFIYKSLLVLRDQYVPMRVEGTPELRAAYLDKLNELKLEESLTGDGINYNESVYTVQWGSTRRALDRHLKGRNARDTRYGFRLYFFWDEESRIVVVGSLPNHLNNRMT